jgi:hypothetical protein
MERLSFRLEPLEPIMLVADSWEEFHRKVTDEEDADLVLLDEYFHSADQYLQAIEEKRDVLFGEYESLADISESILTKRCLGRLTFGGNFVFEDTTGSISNFSVAPTLLKIRRRRRIVYRELLYQVDDVGGLFRKQTFYSSVEKSSPRVDIMVRFPCGNVENQILETSHTQNRFLEHIPYYVAPTHDANLPTINSISHRVMSWNLVAWIELKAPSVDNLIAHVDQAAYYCESALRISPNRKYVFAALTNLKSLVFVCTKVVGYKEESGSRIYRSFHSVMINDIYQLRSFLITSPQSFAATQFQFPYDIFTPIESLGRGSSSCVILGRLRNNAQREAVLKISANTHCITIERMVLTRLRTLYPNETTFPRHMTLSAAEAILLDDAHCELFTERYERIPEDAFGEAEVLSIWNTLRLAHAAGVAHCDIRTTNCMKLNGNETVLIDWSYARPLAGFDTFSNVHPVPLYQSPTLITASKAVLNQFKTRNFAVTVLDEAYSLILMALQAKFPNIITIRKAYGTVDMTVVRRDTFMDNMRSKGEKWDARFPNIQPTQVELVDSVVNTLEFLMDHREAGIMDDAALNALVTSTVQAIFQMSFTILDHTQKV